MAQLQFGDVAAIGYDRTVGEMTRRIVPLLLDAARLQPGQRVLDIATGTGLAAEAAATIVGSSGNMVAADISSAMLERARARLGRLPNVSFAMEDGQALTFPDHSFDAVICNMGVFFFPNPTQGLGEFHRVCRRGGRVALTVFTRADRALVGGLLRVALAKNKRAKEADVEQVFGVGREDFLCGQFAALGFSEIQIKTESIPFHFDSFEAYFDGVERGAGHMGQEYLALPEGKRQVVREDIRQLVGDTGGTIDVEVEVRSASATK